MSEQQLSSALDTGHDDDGHDDEFGSDDDRDSLGLLSNRSRTHDDDVDNNNNNNPNDEDEDEDEYDSLLGSNTASTAHRKYIQSSAARKWRKYFTLINVAIVILGAVEFLIGFVIGKHSFAGSVVAYILGCLGLLSALLSGSAIHAAKHLEKQDQLNRSLSLLSFFLHAGLVLVITFATFAVGVLSISSLFWDYTNVHWTDNSDWGIYSLSKEEAQSQVRRTILSIGIMGLISVILLVCALISSFKLHQRIPLSGQSLLWSNLMLGMSGSTLISISVYSFYHTGLIPVSSHESMIIHGLGIVAFSMSLFAMYRMYNWPRRAPQEWTTIHSGGLLVIVLFLAAFSSVLFYRSTHIDAYLEGDNAFSRYSLRSIGGTRDVHKLRVHAQLRLTIYSLTTFVATVYTLIAGVFALFMDMILVPRASLLGIEIKEQGV